MLRDILMVVMVVGAVGMLVILAYAATKQSEALRRERAARNAALLARGVTPTNAVVLKRMAIAMLLVAALIGALAAWLAGTWGASSGVQLVVFMAAMYVASWITLLTGRWLLRSSRNRQIASR
jgi:hypothetical protein